MRVTRAMRLVVGALAAAALGSGACKEDKRIRRSDDAGAPVQAVEPAAGGEVLYTAEREPNDAEAAATPLTLPGGAQGALDGEADVDVYRVEIAEDSMLRVEVDGLEGIDLILELRDAQGAVAARSDRGGAAIGEGIPNAGVARGTYFVAVREFVKPRREPKKSRKGKSAPVDAAPEGRTGPSPTYRLSARVEPAQALSEREPNDDAGTAGDLYLADQVRGFIGWTGDVDVWKLSLEGLGAQNAVDVEVSAVPGLVLSLDILDAAGRPIVARKGGKDGPVAARSLVVAPVEGAPPFLHVKIAADRSSPVDAYTLKVSPRVLELDEEAEPNDLPERATALRVAGAESGTMRAAYVAGDVDNFRLDAGSGPVLLDVAVETPAGVDLVLEVRGAAGALLGTADAGKAGERERISGVILPAGASAVIAVAAKLEAPAKDAKGRARTPPGDAGEPRPYQLRWSVSPADDAPAMPPEETPEGTPGGGGAQDDPGKPSAP